MCIKIAQVVEGQGQGWRLARRIVSELPMAFKIWITRFSRSEGDRILNSLYISPHVLVLIPTSICMQSRAEKQNWFNFLRSKITLTYTSEAGILRSTYFGAG